jgi:Cdc6-like AAA superfamily ATPase
MSRFFVDYEPKDLSEVVIGKPSIMPIFQSIANGTSTTNLLLYGPVGTGKTAIAKLITELYYTNRDESNWTTFIDLTRAESYQVAS